MRRLSHAWAFASVTMELPRSWSSVSRWCHSARGGPSMKPTGVAARRRRLNSQSAWVDKVPSQCPMRSATRLRISWEMGGA